MEPNFNVDELNPNIMDDKPKPPKISDKPYYQEPEIIKIKKTGFTSYFWIIFALVWTAAIFGGVYFLYINHFNLNGIIQVTNNNQYAFAIPVNNTNNNQNTINVDPKMPTMNVTINNIINSTGNYS